MCVQLEDSILKLAMFAGSPSECDEIEVDTVCFARSVKTTQDAGL